MTNVSNNIVAARPSYNSTKKGTAIGLGAGIVGATASSTLALSTLKMAVKNRDFGKNFIEISQAAMSAKGLNPATTTVTKIAKVGIKTQAVKMLALWTAVGAGVGLAVDLIKNHNAKKAEKVDA